MRSKVPMILLLGVGALALTRKKKRKSSRSAVNGSSGIANDIEVNLVDDNEFKEPEINTGKTVQKERTIEEVILSLEDARGRARLGSFYQIKKGDTLLKIAREALYGTRATLQDQDKRDAVVEFSIIIDCVPWNQATVGRSSRFLKSGHASIVRGSALGISFDPIYADNRLRMLNGSAPSGAQGNNYAYIWIPMVNLDLLDSENIVTTQDMDWPDTEDGRGHSMIDPPIEILKLGFDDITNRIVGCGENKRVLQANA